MLGEEAPERYEFRVLPASGGAVWVQANVVFTTWEGGKAAVSFLRDVSLEKKLADQLVHSRKMEAIGRLAGGIAHDFNNLLSVILGYANLLLGRPGSGAPHSKEIREIGKAAERAAELTRQILAFSRKQLLQPKVVNLNDIVSGVTPSLRRLVREDIEVSSALEADLPPVLVDPGQVEQVILNLAVNARDAMPNGGSLRIGTKAVALSEEFAREHPPLAPGGHVVLFVSDTGTGMEQGILQKIFEPFFTTKELGKGTGLGLATVEGIVSQSRGVVSVESEPGRGTTFSIYLPEAGRTPPEPEAVRPEWRAGGDGTVLVAEDDPAVRGMVREVLADGGYTVLSAAGGEEALRRAREHPGPIRLLVTDVVMPGMSGPELADGIRRERPGLMVIFMSGYAADALAGRDAAEEEVGLLRKPFSPAALLERVRKVLDA
jgi:signal transduction histidine kinase/CheY-like chemotaxis protein